MKTRTALIGSGFIGLDLLIKLLKSPSLDCHIVYSRTENAKLSELSELHRFMICNDFTDGFKEHRDLFDVIFDTTTAEAHLDFYPQLRELGKKVVNLTPAPVGEFYIPSIRNQAAWTHLNLISCGGQAGVPIVKALSNVCADGRVDYAELVSSMASKSVGPGSRANVDEYIHTTQDAMCELGGARKSKLLLVLNPAMPPVSMKVTIRALGNFKNLSAIESSVAEMVRKVQESVPGYRLTSGPVLKQGREVIVTVEVLGAGDFLPKFAGNLDIITSVAVSAAASIK